MVQTIFSIQVDNTTGVAQIQFLKQQLDQTKELAQIVEKEAHKSIRRAIRVAQLGWGLVQGMVRAAGGSISMTTRLVISAGFGAVQALYPVLSAALGAGIATLDAPRIASALAGLAQLGLSIAALVAFETQQKQISLQLRGATFALSNVSAMLYAWG